MSDLIPWLAPWSGRIVVIVIALLGAALTLWAVRRRRWTSPRCRRCSYDLSASPSLKCPECGWAAQDRSQALRGRRRWKLVALGLVITLALPTFVFIKRTKQFGWEYYLTFGPGHYFFGKQTLDTITVSGVTVRVIRDRSPNVWQKFVEITDSAGTHTLESFNWTIGDKDFGRGQDITGNSKPDIILTEYTGGAHCCFVFHVYEIDAPGTLRELVTVDGRDGGRFEDFDGDTLPEFITEDWSLAYELTCFACLRYPTVILKFDGEAYVPAIELMRTPEPTESPSQVARRIYREQEESQLDPRDALFGEMLYRIYTGHADSAWQCFNVAWRPEMGDQVEARTRFLDVLRASPYIDALRQLNDGTLEPSTE